MSNKWWAFSTTVTACASIHSLLYQGFFFLIPWHLFICLDFWMCWGLPVWFQMQTCLAAFPLTLFFQIILKIAVLTALHPPQPSSEVPTGKRLKSNSATWWSDQKTLFCFVGYLEFAWTVLSVFFYLNNFCVFFVAFTKKKTVLDLDHHIQFHDWLHVQICSNSPFHILKCFKTSLRAHIKNKNFTKHIPSIFTHSMIKIQQLYIQQY